MFFHTEANLHFHLALSGPDSTLVDIKTAINMFEKHFKGLELRLGWKTFTVGWNAPLGSSRKAEFYLRVHSENTESSLGSLSRCVPCSWEMWHHTFQCPQKVSIADFWSQSWGLCTSVAPNTPDTGRKRIYWKRNAKGFLDVGFLVTLYLQQKRTVRLWVHKEIEEGYHSCRTEQIQTFVCRNSYFMKIRQNAQSALNRESVGEKNSGKLVFLEILAGTDRVLHYQKLRWKQAKKFVPKKMNTTRWTPAFDSKFWNHCADTLRIHLSIY